jgi:CheY-like chemotaxis protein
MSNKIQEIESFAVSSPLKPRSNVSEDTLTRVERACLASPAQSWDKVVASCKSGAIWGISFAQQRPDRFVKEFATLVRADGLDFGADSELRLYLGDAEKLSMVLANRQLYSQNAPVGSISRLGQVQDYEIRDVSLALPARGIKQGTKIPLEKLPQAGVSVLILDDEPVSRHVLSAILNNHGCTTACAGEAEIALSLLRQTMPDVIVLDIVLGGNIDGIDFCRTIRRNAIYGSIPVVFVTAHVSETVRARCSDIPLSIFLEKPVDATRLRDCITRFAGKRSRVGKS